MAKKNKSQSKIPHQSNELTKTTDNPLAENTIGAVSFPNQEREIGELPKQFQFLDFLNFGVHNRLLYGCICVLFAFLFYGNTLTGKYAVDDYAVIIGSASVQGGIKYIPNLLRDDQNAGKPITAEQINTFAGGRYRPLSQVTFAIEKEIFKDNKPEFSHFINVLLFGLCLLVIYRVASKYFFASNPEIALLAVLIFAVHPIHTEVVANIKSRDEIMSLLLSFLALWGIIKVYLPQNKGTAIIGGKWVWMFGIGFIYFLALLSRETAVTFLLLAPLTLFYIGYSNGRNPNKPSSFSLGNLLSYCLPLFIAFVIYFVIRYQVLKSYEALPFYDQIRNYQDELNNPFIQASFTQKYATIFNLLTKYIVILFYPHPLCWDYSFKEIPYNTLKDPEVYISLAFNGFLLGYAFYSLPKKSWFGYSILFYFISLSIVSNVFFPIGVAFAERFIFQPSLGFALFISFGLYYIADKWQTPAIMKKIIFGSLIMVAIGLLAFKTWDRNAKWATHESLCLEDVKSCPNSAKTNINAGDVHAYLARTAKDETQRIEHLKKAIHYYQITKDILPNWFNADSGYKVNTRELSNIYYEKARQNDIQNGAPQKTIELLKQAASAAPKWGGPQFMLGQFYDRINDPKNAILAYQKATQIAPDSINYWYRLGERAFDVQDYNLSSDAFAKCAGLLPNNPMFWYNSGVAAQRAGNNTKAQTAFENVLKIDPNHAQAQQGLLQVRK